MSEERDPYLYVVCEIGWEYNDEEWYRPESEGVMPKNAFTLKELAEECCDEMNVKYFREEAGGRWGGLRISDWTSYDKWELGDYDIKTQELLDKFSIDPSREFRLDDIEMSDADIESVLKALGIVWFEVVPVELIA